MWGSTRVGPEAERVGKIHKQEPLLWFLWEEPGEAGLGLASLNKFSISGAWGLSLGVWYLPWVNQGGWIVVQRVRIQ